MSGFRAPPSSLLKVRGGSNVGLGGSGNCSEPSDNDGQDSPLRESVGTTEHGRAFGRTLAAWEQWLFEPVTAASLCVFRILFGACLLMQTTKFLDMFEDFKMTSMVFPYGGLGYFPPVPPDIGNMLLYILGISSITTMLGVMTRLSCVVNFVTFTYLFHICESNHNNHYILFCYITFATIFLDWGVQYSVDSALQRMWKKGSYADPPTLPRWQLLVMQMMFNIPYFYGAIAKCNYDWLFRAEPPITWFGRREGFIYHYWWYPWFIAWSGTAYDGIIVFLLYHPKTRYIIAFPCAIMFNVMNKFMFNIGVFPIAMVCSLVLFIDPNTICLVVTLAFKGSKELPAMQSVLKRKGSSHFDVEGGGERRSKDSRRSWGRVATLTGLATMTVFHAVFPLRHFFIYPDNPSWTEEGHHGSWHMMLRTKTGWSVLEAIDTQGEHYYIASTEDPTINYRQGRKLAQRPHMLVLYADHLQRVFARAGRPLTKLHVHSCYALNGRVPQPLYYPEANLLDYIGKYETIGVSLVGKLIVPLDPIHGSQLGKHQCNLHVQSVNGIRDPHDETRDAFETILKKSGLDYVMKTKGSRIEVMYNQSTYAYVS